MRFRLPNYDHSVGLKVIFEMGRDPRGFGVFEMGIGYWVMGPWMIEMGNGGVIGLCKGQGMTEKGGGQRLIGTEEGYIPRLVGPTALYTKPLVF